jgi:hypothetical protein
MLLAVDFYEDLIDEEGVAVASVLPLQSSSVLMVMLIPEVDY